MTVMQIDVIKNGKKSLLAGFVNKGVVLLCPFIEKNRKYYNLKKSYGIPV